MLPKREINYSGVVNATYVIGRALRKSRMYVLLVELEWSTRDELWGDIDRSYDLIDLVDVAN